ncbi:MAG: hypothetical protein OEL54_05000 [Flavobacteriaceae bacterium]|nr:hypothetical protein [Flavobacteriaceae bacterium]
MNATEARKLSEDNQTTLDQVLEQIKHQALYGATNIVLFNLNSNSVPELMKLGYKLSIHRDIMSGIEHYLCSW